MLSQIGIVMVMSRLESVEDIGRYGLSISIATIITFCNLGLRITALTGPEARFIIVMRDPVARAYSAYWHQKRNGNKSLDFEASLEAEPKRIAKARTAKERWWRHDYLEVGRYAGQLELAFSLLGRDRVLVLTGQDPKDTAERQVRLRAHIDLPPSDTVPQLEWSNQANMPKSRQIHNLIIRDNPIKRIVRAILPREMRTKIDCRVAESKASSI